MATHRRHLDDHWVNELTGKEPPKGGSQMAGHLDRREVERVSFNGKLTYTSEVLDWLPVEARLLDLSKKGCRVASGSLVEIGSRVTVTLKLNDGQEPLTLTNAVVCWNNKQEAFGIQFPPLSYEERLRLQKLVLKYATLREQNYDYTAFRIA